MASREVTTRHSRFICRFVLLIFVFVGSSVASAQQTDTRGERTTTTTVAAKDKKTETSKTVFVEGTLANGLKYFIFQVPDAGDRVDVRLQVEVGSGDENHDEYGSAHMLEHLVFQGGKHYPTGSWNYLMNQGWQRGRHYNASTTYEFTTYMFSPPKGKAQLKQLWAVLADMVFTPTLSAEKWELERKVVLEEWRARRGVGRRMSQKRRAVIRSGAKQTQSEIIGREIDIKTRQVETLQKFHQRWYQPSNMKLVVVIGDIDSDTVEQQIKANFSRPQNHPIPQRGGDYYEPKLQSGWQITQLQDKDSGTSQVAVITRLDDSKSRDYSTKNPELGIRERLIDRYAVEMMSNRLKELRKKLPDSISNIVLRKADVGRHTTAVGLFASVAPDAHNVGLERILSAREQLLRYPITVEEMAEYQPTLDSYIKKMKSKDYYPDEFEKIIYSWVGKVLRDHPIRTPAESAKITERIVPSITLDDINHRIKRWLTAKDKILQMQAPGLQSLTLPTEQALEHQINQLTTAHIDKPQLADTSKLTGKMPEIKTTSTITAEKKDNNNPITEWHLSNGDKVIWLKNSVAKDKVYLSAEAEIGYLTDNLNPWLSKLAASTIMHAAPQGFDPKTLSNWGREHEIRLSQSLKINRWIISGSAEKSGIANLFALYHAQMTLPQIGEMFKSTRLQLMRRMATETYAESQKRQTVSTKLFFGKRIYKEPTIAEIKSITDEQLLEQWHSLRHVPVTYYLLADISEDTIKPFITRYLGTLPRQHQSLNTGQYQLLSGKAEKNADLGNEPRTEFTATSWRQQTWTPQLSAQVNIAQQIANKHLKTALRDNIQGVYSVAFSSKIDNENNRLRSSISFSSEVKRSATLWEVAEKVLAELPKNITDQEVKQAKSRLEKQLEKEIKSPYAWLRRLKLSYREYDDARYLSEVETLLDTITLTSVKAASKKLWNRDNQRILRITPKPENNQ